MLLLRLTLFVLSTALLCEAHAQSAPDAARGLPAGGGLDAARVIELRYGKAAPEAAAPQSTLAGGAAAPVRSAALPGALATLAVENSGRQDQEDVPVTFGQVFGVGEFKAGQQLQARLADGASLPLQTDIKARHPDGSVRHAVLSLVLERLARGQPAVFGLFAAASKGAPAGQDKRAGLPAREVDASVEARLEGKTWTAALRPLLEQGKPALWLDGPLVREWLVAAPLVDADGRSHPHLAARFAVRWYPQLARARIDVTVENNWAFEPAPQNFVYDARVMVGKKLVHAREGLNHYHHARWRKVFWWGAEPAIHIRHDSSRLIAARAVPHYDQSIVIDDAALARLHGIWLREQDVPMGTGLAMRAMPTTGGRPDIGLMPAWAVMYLLGMDPRARDMTMGTADLAGSWSMHYRDRRTGLPVSLLDYPYMTLAGNPGDTHNPATGKREQFPACARRDGCHTPNQHDISHQPAFSYLPYLLTGDHFHLEELQFWAMYDIFNSNPGYREAAKGLLKPEQVRGQAWALRTLGEAAYITPDDHPLKRHFAQVLDANLDWYNATYSDNPKANRLGFISNGYAFAYREKRGIAPWQDDFFTSALGHLVDLGFAKALPLLRWKAAFPVMRMTGEGMCWIQGAMYSMAVREHEQAPFYTSIGEAYRASVPEMAALPCAGEEMASALKLRVGEMFGYSSSEAGYPSNMQPALAYAVDALGEPGRKAWRQFMARSRQPNYAVGPQFAIVPRGGSSGSKEVQQR